MNSILFLTTTATTLRAFLLPFASHFRALGWRVDAMAQGVTTCNECLGAFNKVWEVGWSRNPLDPRNFFKVPTTIRSLVARERYHLVHVHTPVAAFVTRYALRRARYKTGTKLVYTAHGFHFYKGGAFLKNVLFRSVEKLAGRWTDYLVTINREDESAAYVSRIVPPEQIRYVPGIGLDCSFYCPDAITDVEVERLRGEIGLSRNDNLFVMVAEFNHGKRHRDALAALLLLARPDVHLAFAGTGPEHDAMRQLAAELGLGRQVHFLGFQQDIRSLIRASDAVLLPSEREGLPRSVMESLCLGVPVIGANTRGIRDLIESGGGLLVGVGDVNRLANAMAWVLDHPKEAKLMGKYGREQMVAYDIQRILKLHETLYYTALGDTA